MTAVLDASILVELLTMSPTGRRAVEHIRASAGDLHVPHLADNETVSVLRGLAAGGILTADRAAQALVDLRDFPARRWPAQPLFERIWSLRANATTYDATYIALAEALGARLITADEKLARGVRAQTTCEIVVVTAPPPPPVASPS